MNFVDSEPQTFELRDFYFVRHGETDWNREHRGMGQRDIPLNDRGLEQAHQASELLRHEPVNLICSSPLRRARDTADIISRKIQRPVVELPDLMECGWGENEGKVKGQWTEDWINGVDIPGAEPYHKFLQRAFHGIAQALKKEGPILIVSHGGVFWAIQKFARLGSHFDLENGVPVLLRAPI